MNFVVRGSPSQRFQAQALATIAKGDALKFGANGVDVAGDGDQVDGFALEAAGSGNLVWVGRGSMRVTGRAASGVNFALGDQVYIDGTQELDAGSATNVSLGKVVAFDPETAGLVEFDFDPDYTFTHA